MMAQSVDYSTRLTPPPRHLSRGQQSLTRLAIAAIFIGIIAIELVAMGAFLPAALPQAAGTAVEASR
jgi:hypothetical protein